MNKKQRKQRCKDCVCLIDKKGKWFCDEYQKPCKDIDECGEWSNPEGK